MKINDRVMVIQTNYLQKPKCELQIYSSTYFYCFIIFRKRYKVFLIVLDYAFLWLNVIMSFCFGSPSWFTPALRVLRLRYAYLTFWVFGLLFAPPPHTHTHTHTCALAHFGRHTLNNREIKQSTICPSSKRRISNDGDTRMPHSHSHTHTCIWLTLVSGFGRSPPHSCAC